MHRKLLCAHDVDNIYLLASRRTSNKFSISIGFHFPYQFDAFHFFAFHLKILGIIECCKIQFEANDDKKNWPNHKLLFISFIVSMKYARHSVCLFINSKDFISPTANSSVMESNEWAVNFYVCLFVPSASQSTCWISIRSMAIQWSPFF